MECLQPAMVVSSFAEHRSIVVVPSRYRLWLPEPEWRDPEASASNWTVPVAMYASSQGFGPRGAR